MKQFDLSVWLKNKSRKVVTRDGRPVRIVCWDVKSISPIIGIIQDRLGGEFARNYTLNGRYSTQNESEYDLFFAADELNSIIDELKSYLEKTPKEQVEKDWKEIQDWYNHHFTNEKHNEEEELTEFEKAMIQFSHERNSLIKYGNDSSVNRCTHRYSNQLLDLARKEVEKDLPKYKKAKKDEVLDWVVKFDKNGNIILSDVVYKGEYFIMLQSLKILPKEE